MSTKAGEVHIGHYREYAHEMQWSRIAAFYREDTHVIWTAYDNIVSQLTINRGCVNLPLILQKRRVLEKGEPLESRASIGVQEIWGHLLDNSQQVKKKGLVLQRGLEGIPEPEGFERTRGDNR